MTWGIAFSSCPKTHPLVLLFPFRLERQRESSLLLWNPVHRALSSRWFSIWASEGCQPRGPGNHPSCGVEARLPHIPGAQIKGKICAPKICFRKTLNKVTCRGTWKLFRHCLKTLEVQQAPPLLVVWERWKPRSALKETGGPGSFSSGESAVTPALLSWGVRGPYGVTVTEEALESGCQGFSPGLLAEWPWKIYLVALQFPRL